LLARAPLDEELGVEALPQAAAVSNPSTPNPIPPIVYLLTRNARSSRDGFEGVLTQV
jgi:hypothetical protein